MFKKSYNTIMKGFLKAQRELEVLIKDRSAELKRLEKEAAEARNEKTVARTALSKIKEITGRF